MIQAEIVFFHLDLMDGYRDINTQRCKAKLKPGLDLWFWLSGQIEVIKYKGIFDSIPLIFDAKPRNTEISQLLCISMYSYLYVVDAEIKNLSIHPQV